jgi:methyl-accepting chemotaxis protein
LNETADSVERKSKGNFNENLVETLEQSLRQTRNAKARFLERFEELKNENNVSSNELERLVAEIDCLETSAKQIESAIDSLSNDKKNTLENLNLWLTKI